MSILVFELVGVQSFRSFDISCLRSSSGFPSSFSPPCSTFSLVFFFSSVVLPSSSFIKLFIQEVEKKKERKREREKVEKERKEQKEQKEQKERNLFQTVRLLNSVSNSVCSENLQTPPTN